MKLAINLVYHGAGALARKAEEHGYALALAPEGYRSDAPSVLGFVAGQTERIALASGVMQIPGRPPAMAALTAATLDALSGGRFRLGLGVSNPDVAQGWYGEPFDHPLARTREYVQIVRAALQGGPVCHDGTHYPLPSGAGTPLHLYTNPLPADLPVYLAAVGPQNLRLTGEIADGWIGVFASPATVKEAIDNLAAGRAKAARTPLPHPDGVRGRTRSVVALDGFEVVPCLATAFADDPADAADLLRGQYVYLMGIGDPDRNFYCAMVSRLGFGGVVETLHDRLRAGDRVGAGAALPFDLIDSTALIGPVGRVADRLAEYADAGVTTLGIMVSAAATDLDGRLSIVQDAATALELSGVDD